METNQAPNALVIILEPGFASKDENEEDAFLAEYSDVIVFSVCHPSDINTLKFTNAIISAIGIKLMPMIAHYGLAPKPAIYES